MNSLVKSGLVASAEDLHGCGFHYVQSLWRRASGLHLRKQKLVKYGKILVLLLQLMQFVKRMHLDTVYGKIKEIFVFPADQPLDTACKEMLRYWEKNYLKEKVYKIKFWSAAENMTEYSRLTNNNLGIINSNKNLESWHSVLHTSIKKKTPSMAELITKLSAVSISKIKDFRHRVTIMDHSVHNSIGLK